MASVEQIIQENFGDSDRNNGQSGDGVQFDVQTWASIGSIIIAVTSAVSLYIEIKNNNI